MKLNPNVHHTVSRTTANQPPDVLPRKFGAVRPNQPNTFERRPISGAYIQAKISATAADGTTYGAKNANRKNVRPCRIRDVSTANSSGNSTRIGVVSTVNRVECHIDFQKSLLVRTSE